MRQWSRYLALLLLLLLLCAGAAFGQWPAWPNSNRLVAGRAEEQTQPKIAATPDGGCVIVWQDFWNGNYDTYMQRVTATGILQWAVGLPVSTQTQDTWLTDYDVQVDGGGNVLIAINDIRHGADRDVTAYRITPAGQFMWGVNGVAVSNNNDVEPNPRIVGTTNNNAVLAWTGDRDSTAVIYLRKLSSIGQDMWSPATLTLTDSIRLSQPRIAATDNDGVILLYLRHLGHETWSPRHIYVQKYNAAGAPQWGADGVRVDSAGGIGPQVIPEILADGAGGAYAYWYAARDGVTYHIYAQHVLANGTAAWTANGVPVATTAEEMQMYPTLVRVPGGDDVMLFYQISNLTQNTWGIGGQKLNAAGELRWGTGVAFRPLDDEPCLGVSAQPQPQGATVTYLRQLSAGGTTSELLAFRVDGEGLPVWTTPTHVLSAVASDKAIPATTVNAAGQVVAVWRDTRRDVSGDIYLQNVNPDGTLGPLEPAPPTLSITSPAENTVLPQLPFTLEFGVTNFLIAAASGDGVVAVIVNGDTVDWHTSLAVSEITGLPEGESEIILALVDYAHQPLEPPVADTLHVLYQPNGVTDNPALPTRLALGVYPNPFNAQAQITLDLPHAGPARLTLYNTLGREVAILLDAALPAGAHRVRLDGTTLSTGVYLCRLESGADVQTQKILLLK